MQLGIPVVRGELAGQLMELFRSTGRNSEDIRASEQHSVCIKPNETYEGSSHRFSNTQNNQHYEQNVCIS